MKGRLTSMFRLFIIFSFIGIGLLQFQINVQAVEKETPLLQFPVISDVHICGEPQPLTPPCINRDQNFENALRDINKHLPVYPAIAVVGDLTDQGTNLQYQLFNQILHRNTPLSAEKVLAIGNHEFFEKRYNPTLTDSEMISRFLNYSNRNQLYYDTWINDYHFIVLGSEETKNGDYNQAYLSDNQYLWLEKQLAVNANDHKPIFVFLHQPIKDTVYGSDLWSAGEHRLREILKKYPQVILFSGHTHYLLDHPRTVYQEGFTMVNTGSVAYSYYDGGAVNHFSQGLVVDVYQDRVDIKARNFKTGSWIKTYSVKIPYEKTYDDRVAPIFRKDAAITIENTTHNSVTLSWDSAVDNILVDKYILKVNGKEWTTAYPKYWEHQSKNTATLTGLDRDMEYKVEIYAVDGWENQSRASLKVDIKTNLLFSGWIEDEGQWSYYDPQTGERVTGWYNDGKKTFYLDSNGVMLTGWQEIDGKRYFFSKDGVMKTGWFLDKDIWYFFDKQGALVNGWVEHQSKWYYMSNQGMVYGWIQPDETGNWYYLNDDGSMKTGWLLEKNKWYYLESSGRMKTGWLSLNNAWYYLDKNGVMKTDWLLENGTWYYLENSGKMKTGWLSLNGDWYFFKPGGQMVIGWRRIDHAWYYFYPSGKMASNTIIEGFSLGQNGRMVETTTNN